jgi:ABC-type branched-subunit amino acid transport system substrate-binding protein
MTRSERSTAERRCAPPWWIVVSVLVVAASTVAGGQAVTRPVPDGPIRIGFIAPLSGPNAQNGRDILNGFLLYPD